MKEKKGIIFDRIFEVPAVAKGNFGIHLCIIEKKSIIGTIIIKISLNMIPAE